MSCRTGKFFLFILLVDFHPCFCLFLVPFADCDFQLAHATTSSQLNWLGLSRRSRCISVPRRIRALSCSSRASSSSSQWSAFPPLPMIICGVDRNVVSERNSSKRNRSRREGLALPLSFPILPHFFQIKKKNNKTGLPNQKNKISPKNNHKKNKISLKTYKKSSQLVLSGLLTSFYVWGKHLAWKTICCSCIRGWFRLQAGLPTWPRLRRGLSLLLCLSLRRKHPEFSILWCSVSWSLGGNTLGCFDALLCFLFIPGWAWLFNSQCSLNLHCFLAAARE